MLSINRNSPNAHLQQPTVLDGVQLTTVAERATQCSVMGAQALIGQAAKRPGLFPSASEVSNRRVTEDPARSRNEAGQLDWTLPEETPLAFCQPHPIALNWYFLCVPYATNRCSHRAQQRSEQFPGTSRFNQAFGIAGNPSLSPPSSAIGRRLRQSNVPDLRLRLLASSDSGFQITFPALSHHRFPILGRPIP